MVVVLWIMNLASRGPEWAIASFGYGESPLAPSKGFAVILCEHPVDYSLGRRPFPALGLIRSSRSSLIEASRLTATMRVIL